MQEAGRVRKPIDSRKDSNHRNILHAASKVGSRDSKVGSKASKNCSIIRKMAAPCIQPRKMAAQPRATFASRKKKKEGARHRAQ